MPAYCPFCGSELDPDSPSPSGMPGVVECPTCRQEVDLPNPPPPPAPALPALGNVPEPPRNWVPWEGEGGFFSRLFSTIGQVLIHPVRFFLAPARPGYAWSLSYGLILGTLGQACQVFWGHGLGYQYATLRGALLSLIFSPLLVLASMFITTWVVHLCLLILGGAKQGVRATFRVMAYGQATNIFTLLPYVGLMVMPVWGLVVGIGGLAAAHGIGRWRAFFAFILPLMLIVFLVLAVFILVVVVGLGSAMMDQLRGLPGI